MAVLSKWREDRGWDGVGECIDDALSALAVSLTITSPRLSLNRGGRWGTTDDFTTIFLHFLCSSLPSGTWRTPGLSTH